MEIRKSCNEKTTKKFIENFKQTRGRTGQYKKFRDLHKSHLSWSATTKIICFFILIPSENAPFQAMYIIQILFYSIEGEIKGKRIPQRQEWSMRELCK
jgi:hypothetical protein